MDNGAILGIIMSSSVVSSLATAFFSHLSSRKNNTLSHITNERKVWRENIKNLATKIQDCEYQGTDKKDINKYLVRLKVNINPYGKEREYDFEHDAHVWMEIKRIEKPVDEDYFNKHKKLLIYYLSLMLKEDWERSKREIKGYSKTVIEILVFMIFNCSSAIFYLINSEKTKMEYVNWLYTIIVGTIFIYAIVRNLLFIYKGKPVKDYKIKKHYEIEIIIANVVVVSIIYWISVLSLLELNNKFMVDDRKFLFYVVIVGNIEIAIICLNWANEKLNNYFLSLLVVNEREKVLDYNKEYLERFKVKVDIIYQNILVQINVQNKSFEEVKYEIHYLQKYLVIYKKKLKFRKKELYFEDKDTNVEDYHNVIKEILRVNDMYIKLCNFSKEGIINKIFKILDKIHLVHVCKKIGSNFKNLIYSKPGNTHLN